MKHRSLSVLQSSERKGDDVKWIFQCSIKLCSLQRRDAVCKHNVIVIESSGWNCRKRTFPALFLWNHQVEREVRVISLWSPFPPISLTLLNFYRSKWSFSWWWRKKKKGLRELAKQHVLWLLKLSGRLRPLKSSRSPPSSAINLNILQRCDNSRTAKEENRLFLHLSFVFDINVSQKRRLKAEERRKRTGITKVSCWALFSLLLWLFVCLLRVHVLL